MLGWILNLVVCCSVRLEGLFVWHFCCFGFVCCLCLFGFNLVGWVLTLPILMILGFAFLSFVIWWFLGLCCGIWFL